MTGVKCRRCGAKCYPKNRALIRLCGRCFAKMMRNNGNGKRPKAKSEASDAKIAELARRAALELPLFGR